MDDPTKPYELTFDERPGYLYACIKAETIDGETVLRYLREVADKCAELQCHRLMLERDIPAMLPNSELFFTTNDFVKTMTGRRVAFLNRHLSIEESMEFAIMIGTNRGADFTVHSNIADAENWLLK